MASVLIAEEDRLLRWSLEEKLRHYGYAVRSVESGPAAVEAARGGSYRVAVISFDAADPSGARTLRWIKFRSPETHVIVMTSDPSSQVERHARNLGAFDVLEKPFPLAMMQPAVERAAVTPERRKGPRGCCSGCEWMKPCHDWQIP